MTLAALITLIGQLGFGAAAWRLATKIDKRCNGIETRVVKVEAACGISSPQLQE